MSEVAHLLWWIPGLPLAAALITAFLGPRLLRKQSHWPCILGVVGACLLSCMVVSGVHHGALPAQAQQVGWFQAGNVEVRFNLRADGLTAIMLLAVTFVGSWIAIFSVGYMSHERAHEAGYARFFAAMALFIFSMTGLVLADNFILLYAFWEGVGLCSYLLIGFWFHKPSAAAAARKAFLVTRLGDVGLLLGIILLWTGFQVPPGGPSSFMHRLDYDEVFRWAGVQEPALLGGVGLLLFCGAVGKSAQFPLHVWLPDAMEGPTPVSALIHAATMVTAGVYLVARCMPIFHAGPDWVLLVVACTGAFSALLAALIALTQHDLKRVLAYSTISQLGYMFLALGCGNSDGLVLLAVLAAIFHLFTHAFFKALLFLSAGSVMHAMGNVIDMRRLGGLCRLMPVTHWTFLAGALALAGLPIFSGFWSKDEILGVALAASQQGHYGGVYWVLFVVAALTAALTAFYTFRAYFLTFHGEPRLPAEAGAHAHESPPVMTVPLLVLAVGAVFAGMIVEPFTHWFSGLLDRHWAPAAFAGGLPAHEHHLNYGLMLGSTLMALSGFGVAWWMYYLRPGRAARVAAQIQGLYQLSLNKFHVDEIYNFLIVAPLSALAGLCRIFDVYVIDSLVDLVGQLPSLIGRLLRPIQNGLVQFYALAMLLGLTVFLSALVVRLAR